MSSDLKWAFGVGGAGLAVFFFALGVVPHLLPGDEDDAVRNAQAFFNTVAIQEPLGVYNSLHPELQERVTFARCQQMMGAYRELFSKIKAQRAIEVQGRGPFAYDVESDFTSGGNKHVLRVHQRGFNGMRRITDGQIESLQYGTNLALISDITLDGRSIFSEVAAGAGCWDTYRPHGPPSVLRGRALLHPLFDRVQVLALHVQLLDSLPVLLLLVDARLAHPFDFAFDFADVLAAGARVSGRFSRRVVAFRAVALAARLRIGVVAACSMRSLLVDEVIA